MEARERKYERKFKNVKRHLKNLSENKFFNESYVEVMVADKGKMEGAGRKADA